MKHSKLLNSGWLDCNRGWLLVSLVACQVACLPFYSFPHRWGWGRIDESKINQECHAKGHGMGRTPLSFACSRIIRAPHFQKVKYSDATWMYNTGTARAVLMFVLWNVEAPAITSGTGVPLMTCFRRYEGYMEGSSGWTEWLVNYAHACDGLFLFLSGKQKTRRPDISVFGQPVKNAKSLRNRVAVAPFEEKKIYQCHVSGKAMRNITFYSITSQYGFLNFNPTTEIYNFTTWNREVRKDKYSFVIIKNNNVKMRAKISGCIHNTVDRKLM